MEDLEQVTTLRTLLATYPHTEALKAGKLHSDLLRFEFSDVNVAHRGFKDLVREVIYDTGQLALVTYLQAWEFEKPYVLMPAVVVARGQHHILFYNPERGHLEPTDLQGKRVGVRSYTQTTGAWLRGILDEDYGVDPTNIRWVTLEGAHVAEYEDPQWVERAEEGKQLQRMLLDGEIDAAILEGSTIPDPRFRRIFSEAENVEESWAAKNGGVPINHMMVIKKSIARDRPDLVKELYGLLVESKRAATAGKDLSAIRFGVEPCRPLLAKMIDYAVRQKLIQRHVEVDELFDDVTRALV